MGRDTKRRPIRRLHPECYVTGADIEPYFAAMLDRIEQLEARVSELEAHPHDCTCTRCTG